MTHTHVGARGATGHYAVTADAYRTPGKPRALNLKPGHRCGSGYATFVGLCGTVVAETSGDHFVGANPIYLSGERKVTCKRCLKELAKARPE
jgi:hypothetical protein